MPKITEIPVCCWHCGERFYIEIASVYAGTLAIHLFCSDKCRVENLKEEIKLRKRKE